MNEDLSERVREVLLGDSAPDSVDAYRFGVGIRPAFGLLRSLFTANELDTVLKLMVLFEVSRTGGRVTLDRIRILAGFLPNDKVDALVRTLREGGWLDLRDSDHSYSINGVGLQLLSLLHAADLGSLTPSNAIARAAQNAEFAARLDGSQAPLGFLLDQLRALLEEQVVQAQQLVSHGRPFRLIAWSRRQHAEQLDTLSAVLDQLQARMDAASQEFARVVRLHQCMIQLVQLHSSLHKRLRDWNLEQLHSSDSGYALTQLCEAVMGAEEKVLAGVLDQGLVQPLARAPGLPTEEVLARFHGARRRLSPEAEDTVYTPPPETLVERFVPASVDPTAALRARLTELFAQRGPHAPPISMAEWLHKAQIPEQALGEACWQMANLCRLEGGSGRIRLDDGRTIAVLAPTVDAQSLPPGALLQGLEACGVLERLPWGWLTALRLSLVSEVSHG